MGNKILVGSNFSGFKNKIINGGFQVKQRGANTLNNNQDFILDRFQSQTAGSIITAKDLIVAPDSTPLADNVDPFGDNSGVALWKLDGDATDAGGNYDGQWKDSDDNDIDGNYDTGMFGQGAKFDGNSYIDTGLGMLDFIKNGGTFSLWVKGDPEENEDYVEFFGYRGEGSIASFSMYWYNSNNRIDFANSTGDDYKYIRYEGFNNIINKWTYLVVTFDGNGKFYGYINGKYIGEQNLSSNDSNTNYNILVGWSKTNSKLKGLIDQVRVFNRALTEDEIQKLYLEESQVIKKPYSITLKTGNKPVDYTTQTIKNLVYRFEGQHLYDLISEGKKATLSFKMTAKKAGKYSIALINKTTSNYETLLQSFDYNGNLDEKVSVTFDLSQFQNEVRNDENLGCELVICGYTEDSNLVGSVGKNDGEKICVSGCVAIDDNDSISITGLQLEEGDVATDFEVIPYDVELQRCMRYYEKCFTGGVPGYYENVDNINYSRKRISYVGFAVNKRTIPAIVVTNQETDSDGTNLVIDCYTNGTSFRVSNTSSSGTYWYVDAFTADAEL